MAKGLWTILNVDNLDKSVEFYKALGLKAGKESQGPMTWGYVNGGSTDTGLVLWNKHEIGPGQADDTRAWLSGELGKGVMISLGVANARRLYEKAQSARVTVEQPLREQEWGGFEFTVNDPDGYVVNLTDRFPGMSPTKPKKKTAARRAKPATKAKGKAKKPAAKRRR